MTVRILYRLNRIQQKQASMRNFLILKNPKNKISNSSEVEQMAVNHRVVGSNPTWGENF
jgi:hypothetical protein